MPNNDDNTPHPTRALTLETDDGPRRLVLRVAAVDEIFGLRHDILRNNLPSETAEFDGDNDPTTIHLGAFLFGHDYIENDGLNIGCASFMLNAWEDAPAWQLRGMAIREDLRDLGVGRMMLDYADELLRATRRDVDRLWCNARTPAVPFYLQLGWEIASPEFVVPTAGPHYRMQRPLPPR